MVISLRFLLPSLTQFPPGIGAKNKQPIPVMQVFPQNCLPTDRRMTEAVTDGLMLSESWSGGGGGGDAGVKISHRRLLRGD